jgi:hypothetical protein
MAHFLQVFGISCLLGALIIAPGAAARSADEQPAPAAPADEAATPGPKAQPGEKPQAAPKEQAKKELSPSLAALRDRVRRTVAVQRQQPFNTRENTVADIAHFCLALGCEAEVLNVGQNGQKVNGITCLCWNLPCGGYEPLMFYEGHLAPRVGFGYQEAPGQLAAVLALSHVPADYPARAGETVRTVADLIESEKLACRSGADLSLKLIALSFYVQEPTWKNSLGEEWSIQRMVKQELNRPMINSAQRASLRLLGLTCALERQARNKAPIEGELLRAKKYVEESQDYALRGQNGDGSWGRADGRDYAATLASTGHVLEWLVSSLPAERLEAPEVVKAVEFVDSLLSSQRYRGSVASLSSQEIGAVMHAAHSLVVYDQRVFQPFDPPAAAVPQKAEKQKVEKTGRKPAE